MPGVRLGVEERETIGLGVARGEAFAVIGRRMGRPTPAVAREVGRNGAVDGYRASVAQRATNSRAARPKVGKLVADVVLAADVAAGLVKRWSPAEIAARLD